MKKYLIFFFILFINLNAHSSTNQEIISHLEKINSLEFKFIQKIDNNNIEKGECTILYPKKILCKYYDIYNKILVSNGKSLVINSDKIKNYYRYPLDKTSLNLILDKNFLIQKIENLKEKKLGETFINFEIIEEENEINIFFDNENFDLVGWQTKDIYQNLNVTYLSSIKKNHKVDKDLFKLPAQN